MNTPVIQGRCPGAHQPMMSGDGLVVRVRPRLARLSRDQILGLCAAAIRHGNGAIDLTNRANLQLRAVTQAAYDPLMAALAELGLLDHDPDIEPRRNILVTPFHRGDDLTARLTGTLIARLGDLPDLPPKFGFAVDTGPDRLLADCSADIRLERGARGGLILRADGAETGQALAEDRAIDRLIELARWFAANAGGATRRMGALLRGTGLPDGFAGTAPAARGVPPGPGPTALGPLFGAPFGQIPAQPLAELIRASGAQAFRVTPWRLFLLEGGQTATAADFITDPDDAALRTDACPGTPLCPQSQAETRDLARRLAARVHGSLHVSGCTKSCARTGVADITLVARQGGFDLVKRGRVGDEPIMRDLSPQTLLSMTDL